MELQGRRWIPAPPPAVWAALNDAAVLQRCIPGCEEVLQLSDDVRSARVAVKLGPVRARFSGKVTLRDVRPDAGCTLVFEGSGGAAGFARGQSSVTLEGEASGTQVGYTVSASVGGKLGQVGGRMIDSAARGMADEFFQALAREWPPADAAAAAVPAGALPASDATDPSAPSGPPAPSGPSGPSGPSAAPAPSPQPVTGARPAAAAVGTPASLPGLEALRVKWFLLGVAATAFGVLLGRWLG